MSERLSDKTVAEWQATVTFLGGGAANGSPIDRLHKDHLRARAEVVAKDERIAALEAELARLTPSGQVAEEQAAVAAALTSYGRHWKIVPPRARDEIDAAATALSRLAAQAQGYEAAVAAMDEDGAGSQIGTSLADRIEALSEDRLGEKVRAERAEEDRDAALADSAALLSLFREAANPSPSARTVEACIDAALSGNHRGAALLARMQALEEVVRTLATGWGGTLSGMADLRAKAQALIDTGTGGHDAPMQVEAILTARISALREHAQLLYEGAPPTNSRTSREHVEQWEKAKRIHHEVLGAQDVGVDLLTELNDHRRNLEVLRDELDAKDDEHVVNALHRWKERLAQAVATIKKMAQHIRSRAGHEENCRGWRKPVKDKSAPAWKRRGEWMDLEHCSCGPGDLLRLADGVFK